MDKITQLDEAIRTLVRVLIIQERRLSSDVAGIAFNPLDLETLTFVGRHPCVPAKDIATYLQVSPTTMQSVVDRLEERGFVLKDKTALKGRSIALSLTPGGIQFRDLMQAHNIHNCEAMLSAIDPRDQERFVDSLVKIANKISGLNQDGRFSASP
jgi:DNA-binding MarR family transcriptional regulator